MAEEINNCSNKCGQPQSNLNIYSPDTLVGNWFEQSVKNSCKRNEFIQARDCNQLAYQKSQIMVDLLLKPVKLTFTGGDNKLYYGDTVQIMSPGAGSEAMKDCPFKNYCHLTDLALSSSLPPSVIDTRQHLDLDSVITASQCIYPCVRNSFILEHPDGPPIGDGKKVPILYGDVFRIKALSTQHKCDLYLSCAPGIKFYSTSKFSGNPIVQFDCKNAYTLWRTFPLALTPEDAQLIIQTETPVEKNHRLLIQHGLSGKNLCMEKNYQIINHFGNEQEVTVETKFDVLKRIDWSNHWYFDTDRSEEKEKFDKDKIAQEEAEAKAKEAKEAEEKEKSSAAESETKDKDGKEPKGEEVEESGKFDGNFENLCYHMDTLGVADCSQWLNPSASSTACCPGKPSGQQYQYPNRKWTNGSYNGPGTEQSEKLRPILKIPLDHPCCAKHLSDNSKTMDFKKHDGTCIVDCKKYNCN